MTRPAGPGAQAASRVPVLPGAGTVHVWWVPAGAVSAPDHDALSAEERWREAALHRREDRERFVTAATVVRRLAGAATGRAPAEAPVERRCRHCGGAHGPPRIPGYEVSVSHSGGWVAVACAADGLVGLDVEATGRDLAPVVGEILGPDERCTVDGLVTRWTRKEAVLKATGLGLVLDPADVVVDETADGPRVVSFRRWPDVERWSLTDLASPDGMTATVATWGAGRPRVVPLRPGAVVPRPS